MRIDRTARIALLWSAAGAAMLWAADSAAQILFDRVASNVRDSISRIPRYTCVETVTRSRYALAHADIGASCARTVAAWQANASNRRLLWHDRVRLDVAISDNSEMFSWPGASKFELGDVTGIVAGGAIGSGDFGTFLSGIFGGDAQDFRYHIPAESVSGAPAWFDFRVPVESSHYRFSSNRRDYQTVGYRGSFYADPVSAELRRLEIVAEDLGAGDACRVADSVDYTRQQIGQDTFVLPNKSRMEIVHSAGDESVNETTYSGCREYVGEATITFGDAGGPQSSDDANDKNKVPPPPLPLGTHLKVVMNPPIDTATAAIGDRITGEVSAEVKIKGEVLARRGDKLHGRILRLEQTMGQKPWWVMALRFETIERAGLEEKISLLPENDGEHSWALDRGLVNVRTERPEGGGIYLFHDSGNFVLGRDFETEWETR